MLEKTDGAIKNVLIQRHWQHCAQKTQDGPDPKPGVTG